MSVLNFLPDLKYKCARFVENRPLLSNAIYNNVSRFKFLFPHEKDYHGIRFFCQSSPDTDFIDIGANIGLSAIGFRKLGFENPMQLFEANPYLAGFLDRLAKEDRGLHVHQLALGADNKQLSLFLAYYRGTCLHTFSSFNREFIEQSLRRSYPEKFREVEIREVAVPVRRFDDIGFERPPQFIKIDVEGFEHEILQGMTRTIEKYRPVFLIEYNASNFSKVFEMLKAHYAVYVYEFKNDRVRPISAEELPRLTDSNYLSHIRNVFYVPKKRNEN